MNNIKISVSRNIFKIETKNLSDVVALVLFIYIWHILSML